MLSIIFSTRYSSQSVMRSRVVYKLVSTCCSGYSGDTPNCKRMYVKIAQCYYEESCSFSTLQRFAKTVILLTHVQPLECVRVLMELQVLNAYVRSFSDVCRHHNNVILWMKYKWKALKCKPSAQVKKYYAIVYTEHLAGRWRH